ncbi:MAG: fibronectin type III domain-containing protein [Planctomycetota bacterium]
MITSKTVSRRTLHIALFALIGLISIVTYGWQCGELGVKEYTLYPSSWTSGSSVYTGAITGTYTGTLTAAVNPAGVYTSVYFEWGSVYGWSVTALRPVGNGTNDVTVTETVTSLLPNTTYTYRLAILREGDVAPTYTQNQSFTTAGRPTCTTDTASNISSISSTLNARVNPNGLATTVYFQWGLSSSYGYTTPNQDIGSGTVNVYVSANITGLNPNVTYFFRVVGINSEGTVYGENRSFNSGPPAPIATTGAASSVYYNSAILNGLVNPNGQETTINFQWGPVSTYGNTTASQIIPASNNNVSVSANLTGLSPNTTYYFRLTARNPAGDSVGSQASFTTPPPPPSATTNPVVTITYNSVVLSATVNPNGLATTAYFQWGTTIAYGSSTSIQSLGSGISSVTVTATLTGLVGNTTYNYRVVATNSSGPTNGLNQSFTTLVPPPTATTNPASSVTTATATLNAQVNPNGGATTVYFLWGTSPSLSDSSSTTPTTIGSGSSPVNIIQTITGLTSSTTYYFRVVAINGTGTSQGIIRNFTTSTQPPTAITLPPTGVTTSTFTFNASVNPNGVATTVYFQWGTTPSYNYGNTSSQSAGNGRSFVPISLGFTGATPGATYYYRVVAYNGGGYSYGLQQSFTTPLPGAPTVITQAATNIGRTTAVLNALVNSNGQNTTVYFQYGTTSTYSPTTWYTQSPPFNNGDGTGDWIISTNGELLPVPAPGTTYYFRAYATNASGTTYGGILSFTTLP